MGGKVFHGPVLAGEVDGKHRRLAKIEFERAIGRAGALAHGDVIEEEAVAFDGQLAGDLFGFEISLLKAGDGDIAAAGHDIAVLMGEIHVQLRRDAAGNIGRRGNERIGLMKREIFNGDVEVSQIFLEVVRSTEGPIAFEKLQLAGFNAGHVLVDGAGELDGYIAEFAAADDDVVAQEIAREIDAARPEGAVGVDLAVEHPSYRTRGIVGMGNGNAPEKEVE